MLEKKITKKILLLNVYALALSSLKNHAFCMVKIQCLNTSFLEFFKEDLPFPYQA